MLGLMNRGHAELDSVFGPCRPTPFFMHTIVNSKSKIAAAQVLASILSWMGFNDQTMALEPLMLEGRNHLFDSHRRSARLFYGKEVYSYRHNLFDPDPNRRKVGDLNVRLINSMPSDLCDEIGKELDAWPPGSYGNPGADNGRDSYSKCKVSCRRPIWDHAWSLA